MLLEGRLVRIVRWLVLIGIFGLLVFAVRDTYRGGYFSLPPLTDDQYPISFKNGLRAVVTVDDLRGDTLVVPKVVRRLSALYREVRFFGIPSEVEFWVEDAWSFCRKPSEQEVSGLLSSLPESVQRNFQRATLAWICFVDVEDEQVFRGMIFTAPRL